MIAAIEAVLHRNFVEKSFPHVVPKAIASSRHSLDAWTERVVLDQVWQKWERERAAWAVHTRVPDLAREYWSREHKLTVYDVALDDFTTQLEREADVG